MRHMIPQRRTSNRCVLSGQLVMLAGPDYDACHIASYGGYSLVIGHISLMIAFHRGYSVHKADDLQLV